MRIGLFSDTYLPDVNGVVSSIVTLQKVLEEHGHEVFVIANHKGLLKSIREGNTLRLPGMELKWLYGYVLSTPYHFSAKEEIRGMNLDVIHAHTEFGVGIFARMVAKDLNIPVVSTYHTMYEDYTHYINKFELEGVEKITRKVAASFSRIITDTCEGVIAPSEKTKDTLLKYGVNVPIHIIPTGLDLKKFNVDSVDPRLIEEVKERYQLHDGDKIMLYVGRIAEEKSIDVAIRGYRKALLQHSNYKMIIVGGGPDLDELRALCEELQIASQVIFTDKQPHELVPVFYALADAFVSFSLTETQGMTFVEALSSGLPVFARRDEVLLDLIDEGLSGYYVNENNFSDVATAYFELDDEQKQKMKVYARNKALPYDCEAFYQDVMKVYEEAINSYHRTLEIKKVKTMDDCVQLTCENNQKEEIKVLLSVDDYFAFELKKNGMLHESTLLELKEREKILKAWRLCIRKISLKDRTRKEMYDILAKDGSLNIKQINDMIERLEEKGYINDQLYLMNEMEKLRGSLEGKGKMIRSLMAKGLPYEEIVKAMEHIPMENELHKAERYALKLQKSIKGKSLKMKKQLIQQKMQVQGFDSSMINQVMDGMSFENEAGEEEALLLKAMEKAYQQYVKKYEGKELHNAILKALVRKGFTSSEVLVKLNEMEERLNEFN